MAFDREAALDALLPSACAACERASRAPLCVTCAETLLPSPVPEGLLAFGGALRDAINAAKQVPDIVRARALARLFVDRAPALGPSEVDVVGYVPAPWRRLAVRGFDLPAVLAQALAEARGVPLVLALAVTRGDAPLSSGADRAARAVLVRGRYRVCAAVAGKRLLLVDDVHTTGATLGEATRVLREAGAAVTPLALAAAL